MYDMYEPTHLDLSYAFDDLSNGFWQQSIDFQAMSIQAWYADDTYASLAFEQLSHDAAGYSHDAYSASWDAWNAYDASGYAATGYDTGAAWSAADTSSWSAADTSSWSAADTSSWSASE